MNEKFIRQASEVIFAHRDPVTQTYHFGADEFGTLEDVLGQLIGYLCTALFPKPVQEHDTEPLPGAVLRETEKQL